MAKEFSSDFYNSPVWRKVRKSYIASRRAVDGGMCEICGNNVGYIVHHKEWLTANNINDTYMTLHYRNLQYVCQSCHNQIHSTIEDEKYMFDSDGMLIEKPRRREDNG